MNTELLIRPTEIKFAGGNGGAAGEVWIKFLPQKGKLTVVVESLGKRYHRDGLFVGEGFAEGEKVWARWTTEDIEPKTGYRENSLSAESILTVVKDGKLNARIPQSRRLTTLVFEPYRD